MKKRQLVYTLLLTPFIMCAQPADNSIRINQLGYYPQAPKLAVVAGNTPATAFYIVSTAANDTVFKGVLSALMQSANSSTQTKLIDFSAFMAVGSFIIRVPGLPASYPFIP